jgi:sarcosine oxidase
VRADRGDWDAIVVGLGGIGSAAAYWLSRTLGDGVLGLEQFELHHANGASADHSRIIRLSYHRRDYVRLAKRAYECWAAVEAEAGEPIVTITGGLDLWPASPAIPHADYVESLTAEGVPLESIDAAEVMRRWPQWRLEADVTAIWQRQGGLADPFKGNAAHRRLALAHGATLRDRTRVAGLRDAGAGELEVRTDEATFRTGRVVIAADAWTNHLLASFGRSLPLQVTREQVTYFSCKDPAAFAPDRFPVWIWMDDPSFYGFPTYGEAGPKVAQDCGGTPVDPNRRTFERDEAAFQRVTRFLEGHLPGALGPPIYTKTCLYTLTPERDFVVDRLPDLPGVAVVLGAGHGFKFASVLGRIAAELSIDGMTPSAPELEAFRIDRPILQEADPATSWMV